MGPEGLNGGGSGGRSCVGVEKVEVFQSEVASVLIKSSANVCSSSLLTMKEPSVWKKIPDAASGFHDEVAVNHVNFGIKMTPALGDNQAQKKSGKLSRVNNGSCKRSRLAQVEISVSEMVLENVKGNCTEPVTEFNQVLKQKNNIKRGEKRNGKALKTRGDTFSLKNGLVSFSSAGVNSFIGDHGSKSDLFDVTKHIDDISLNELLDGNYKCPIYSKDKVKEVTTSNENLLLSLRKAWSILELQKHGPSQKNSESDKSSAELSCYGSSSANRCVVDNEDLQTAECTLSPVVLDSNKNLNSPMVVVNLPLNPPIDVLNCLSLPPSKDLDSLLLDAIKPASSSRSNSDLRLGRLGSWRSGLPPFPWSQSSSAQPKSVSDTIKLSTTRNSCQGRWARVENCVNHPNDSPRVVIDLESLTFAETLVPSLTQEMTPPHTEKKAPSANFPLPIKQIEESSALCSTSHDLPDEHSLGVLGAAQTLYGIASSSMKNPNGMSKWQTKPSKKQLSRMYKSKAKNRESGNQFVEPKSISGTGSILNADGVVRSKKLKLSVDLRSTKINGAYSSKRGPLNSSALRRVTSSPTPSKLFESTIPEMRNGSKNVVNRSCTMPPPSSRVIDNACGSRLKLR